MAPAHRRLIGAASALRRNFTWRSLSMTTTDRTTKVLLLLIAIGLWGLLLRPLLAPSPVQAQGASSSAFAPVVAADGYVYVVAHDRIGAFFIDRGVRKDKDGVDKTYVELRATNAQRLPY
jgi:hypothetical protein